MPFGFRPCKWSIGTDLRSRPQTLPVRSPTPQSRMPIPSGSFSFLTTTSSRLMWRRKVNDQFLGGGIPPIRARISGGHPFGDEPPDDPLDPFDFRALEADRRYTSYSKVGEEDPALWLSRLGTVASRKVLIRDRSFAHFDNR